MIWRAIKKRRDSRAIQLSVFRSVFEVPGTEFHSIHSTVLKIVSLEPS